MMERLRTKQTDEPIYLAQGDITRLPFPTGTFDAVIAVHIFHLIPAWRDAIREVARVLRPGAPLIHGWNERIASNTLQSIWQEATEEAREVAGAIPPRQRATFLAENGWRERGAGESLPFVTHRAPNDYLESIRQRKFSSMWRMSEETLQRGLAAVQAYVAAHYDDPSQPETLESGFRAQAYLPPES
jgi:SAM-dependent methyltransferase